MPQILSQGGRIISNPSFLAITLLDNSVSGSDPWVPQLEEFVSRFAKSSIWNTLTSEYGIESGSAGAPVHIPLPISTDTFADSDIQSWLSSVLNRANHPLGVPDGNTIYTLFMPADISISLPNGNEKDLSCNSFHGYHGMFSDKKSGIKIIYIVVPRCDGETLDDLSADASHEMVEAVTDPDAAMNATSTDAGIKQAFALRDPEFMSWGNASELGDMCELKDENPSAFVRPEGLGFQIQQPWSNAEALAGKDPCDPLHPDKIYFNSSAILTDLVPMEYDSQGHVIFSAKGILLPARQSKTITLQLFSSAPTDGEWSVSIKSDPFGDHTLSYHFDRKTGSNGTIISRMQDFKALIL